MFLDESGASTNMTRLGGRCPIGQRLVSSTPCGHWQTTTMISAVRLSGPFAPAVFDGPTDKEVFIAYVEQALIPELHTGDVVVMDNLSAHKTPVIRQKIEAAGASLLYLPPYSPDFNPSKTCGPNSSSSFARRRHDPSMLSATPLPLVCKPSPQVTAKASF